MIEAIGIVGSLASAAGLAFAIWQHRRGRDEGARCDDCADVDQLEPHRSSR